MIHLGTVELETDRLRLRPFRPEDAGSCLENWAADGRVFRFLSSEPMSRTYAEEWLSEAEKAYRDLTTYYWAIESKAAAGVIGEIFVDDFSERSEWCEIDYKLGPRFWGRRYALEALEAVTAFLFEQVGFHRVQAKCSAANAASERVMQKAGMRREGVLRGFFRRKDGSGYDDVVVYSILREEAKCRREAARLGF